jgi:hypothetical protein
MVRICSRRVALYHEHSGGVSLMVRVPMHAHQAARATSAWLTRGAAMARLRAISCLLVSTLAWGSSHAQPASRLTDRQLQVAYCVGATQARLVAMPQIDPIPSSATEQDRRAIEWGNAYKRSASQDLDNRRRRFLAYLTATGALTNPESTLGVDIARNQGIEDTKQCIPAITSRCIPSGPERPTPPPPDEAERIRKCVFDIPACAKWKRCGELVDQLPF